MTKETKTEENGNVDITDTKEMEINKGGEEK